MDKRPIGVFDSGLGGLTAAKVLEEILPHENIVYFGDSRRMPYGGKSKQEIISLAAEDAAFLSTFNPKAILIACGTITSNAIEELKGMFDIPFFGVVNASCRSTARATKTKRVAVIATPAAIRSGLYESGIKAVDEDITVFSKACLGFSRLVEDGHFSRGDALAEEAVRKELKCLKYADIDTILLGCTHYPLLSDVIADFIGGDVYQVSAGAEAARDLTEYLMDNDMLSDTREQVQHKWFTSGDLTLFSKSAGIFLGHHIEPQQHIL